MQKTHVFLRFLGFQAFLESFNTKTVLPKTLKNTCFFKVFGISGISRELQCQDCLTKNLKKNTLFFKVFGNSGISRDIQSQDCLTKNLKKLIVFQGFWGCRPSRELQESRRTHQKHQKTYVFSVFWDFRSFLESFQCQDCLTFDTGIKIDFYQATSLL